VGEEAVLHRRGPPAPEARATVTEPKPLDALCRPEPVGEHQGKKAPPPELELIVATICSGIVDSSSTPDLVRRWREQAKMHRSVHLHKASSPQQRRRVDLAAGDGVVASSNKLTHDTSVDLSKTMLLPILQVVSDKV
jgi:hypothetical protein